MKKATVLLIMGWISVIFYALAWSKGYNDLSYQTASFILFSLSLITDGDVKLH